MSLVLSPKSGKLVTVGSSQFSELLADPKYRDSILLSSGSPKGSVSPSGLPPISSLKLPPLNGALRSPLLDLPVLPKSPMYSPPSPSSSLEGISMPPLPQLPRIEVSPLNNKNLPPLKIPTISLPPLPKSSPLPPLPKSSPLPPLPKSSPLPPLPKSSPLPPLPKSPNTLPPLSKSPSKSTNAQPPFSKNSAEEILEMQFADIPSLEKTLLTTHQPAKREKLEAMIKSKKYEEGRGIKTRGWAARAPTRGKERHQLHSECGDKCFLNPEQEKFPICASPRVTGGKSKCEIDCQGVQSALIRAKQYGYTKEAAKAEVLLKECNKEGLKHFTPSSPKKYPKMSPSAMLAGKMDKSPRYEREDYLMPRRVARRNVRRSVLLGDEHSGHHHWEHSHHEHSNWEHSNREHENHNHSGHRDMNWEHSNREHGKHSYEKHDMNWEHGKKEKPRNMVKDWDKDEGKHHHHDWDREESRDDKDDHRDYRDHKEERPYDRDYTKKGDYSTIRLSPSMSRLGTPDKTEDCGCGN
jgi:hypothetical protein